MNSTGPGAAVRRRHEIRRLVEEGAVHSQQELQGLLRRRGFEVAQPTLSRDVRETREAVIRLEAQLRRSGR